MDPVRGTGRLPRVNALPRLLSPIRAHFVALALACAALTPSPHGLALTATLAVFLGAIHLLVVDANASSPARMDQPAFVGLMLSFAAVTIVACGIHAIRTRRA